MELSSRKELAYAMTLLKFVSWPLGIWPLQSYNAFSLIRFAFSISVMLSMVVLVQAEIYLDSSNAEVNLESFPMIICGILSSLKVLSYRVYSANLICNFASAVKDYNELDSEEKHAIMRRHAYMGRVTTASVILFAYFSAMLLSIVAAVRGNNKEVDNATLKSVVSFPIPSEHVLASLEVPENLYLLIFFVEYVMMIVTCNANLGFVYFTWSLGSDSLFASIAFHLCGQIEILKMDLSGLKSKNEKTTDDLVSLINRHGHLLELTRMLNNTVTRFLLVQLFTSCTLICTTGFQFIMALNIGNAIMVVKTFMVLSTLLMQMFIYSYVGEYLKRQMEGIAHSAYSCNWYDFPTNVSKKIILVIIKAQQLVHITAGNFFVINMETYATIMKTSISYLSVLRIMVND